MEYLLLTGWCFLGGIVWIFNAEAAMIFRVLRTDDPPLLIALLGAVGQCGGLMVLYRFGAVLETRSKWLRDRLARYDHEWLEKRTLPVVTTAGLFGLPPLLPSAVAAGSLRLNAGYFFIIALVARFVRNIALVYIPDLFLKLLPEGAVDALPF